MARGIVEAMPYQGTTPLRRHRMEYDGPDQPPEDAIIGECVGEAVRAAWRSGHDPAAPCFYVVVTFR